MTIQMILLPLFVEVTLTFVLWFWMAFARRQVFVNRTVHPRDIAVGQRNWPAEVAQVSNSFRNQFELPVVFYVLTFLSIITCPADVICAALACLGYDAPRRRSSSAWIMGADTPRAVLLGMLARERDLDVEAISTLSNGARFAPEPLSDDEHARLRARSLDGAPPHVRGDYPEWLDDMLAAGFGDERADEAEALASRAPLDLRVNTLKAKRHETA